MNLRKEICKNLTDHSATLSPCWQSRAGAAADRVGWGRRDACPTL